MSQPNIQIVERLDTEQSNDPLQVFLHTQRYDLTLSRMLKEDKVLEIGTGAGVFSRVLSEHCSVYVGLEFDATACEITRNRLLGRGLVVQGDAQEMPFADGSFSAIVCLEVLEHLPDFRKAVKEIHRCLAANGRAFVSVPFRKHGGKNPSNLFHLYEPGEAELGREFLKYFSQVKHSYQYFEETTMMTVARVLRVRRFTGLASAYADLSKGVTGALEHIKIGDSSGGLNLTLFFEVSGKLIG